MIYKVPEEQISKLRDCYYEVESYRTVLQDLIRQGVDVDTFREKYKEALINYDQEKSNFEINFVKIINPDAKAWNLTFGDSKIFIE